MFVLADSYVVCSVIKNHSTAAAVFNNVDKLQLLVALPARFGLDTSVITLYIL